MTDQMVKERIEVDEDQNQDFKWPTKEEIDELVKDIDIKDKKETYEEKRQREVEQYYKAKRLQIEGDLNGKEIKDLSVEEFDKYLDNIR